MSLLSSTDPKLLNSSASLNVFNNADCLCTIGIMHKHSAALWAAKIFHFSCLASFLGVNCRFRHTKPAGPRWGGSAVINPSQLAWRGAAVSVWGRRTATQIYTIVLERWWQSKGNGVLRPMLASESKTLISPGTTHIFPLLHFRRTRTQQHLITCCWMHNNRQTHSLVHMYF